MDTDTPMDTSGTATATATTSMGLTNALSYDGGSAHLVDEDTILYNVGNTLKFMNAHSGNATRRDATLFLRFLFAFTFAAFAFAAFAAFAISSLLFSSSMSLSLSLSSSSSLSLSSWTHPSVLVSLPLLLCILTWRKALVFFSFPFLSYLISSHLISLLSYISDKLSVCLSVCLSCTRTVCLCLWHCFCFWFWCDDVCDSLWQVPLRSWHRAATSASPPLPRTWRPTTLHGKVTHFFSFLFFSLLYFTFLFFSFLSFPFPLCSFLFFPFPFPFLLRFKSNHIVTTHAWYDRSPVSLDPSIFVYSYPEKTLVAELKANQER